MSDLADKKCIPCKGGIPGFNISEIHKYLKMVDGWEVKADESNIYYLIKEFKFKNFFFYFNSTNKTNWSGRWDLNPRPSRWQRDALPLSYARIKKRNINQRFFLCKKY